MALTQIQIIQSLGEAMSWLERELNWGVPATELRHLIGRIGELYAALITNGRMATEVNQAGYDVVSQDGERVSVKTTARLSSTGRIAFNPNTLQLVDRIIILRVNTEEMQVETLFDDSVEQAKKLMHSAAEGEQSSIAISKLLTNKPSNRRISKVTEAQWKNYSIAELENGTIEVSQAGTTLSPAKPHLRTVAKAIGVQIINGNGNPYNTRQLGTLLIRALNDQSDTTSDMVQPVAAHS